MTTQVPAQHQRGLRRGSVLVRALDLVDQVARTDLVPDGGPRKPGAFLRGAELVRVSTAAFRREFGADLARFRATLCRSAARVTEARPEKILPLVLKRIPTDMLSAELGVRAATIRQNRGLSKAGGLPWGDLEVVYRAAGDVRAFYEFVVGTAPRLGPPRVILTHVAARALAELEPAGLDHRQRLVWLELTSDEERSLARRELGELAKMLTACPDEQHLVGWVVGHARATCARVAAGPLSGSTGC